LTRSPTTTTTTLLLLGTNSARHKDTLDAKLKDDLVEERNVDVHPIRILFCTL